MPFGRELKTAWVHTGDPETVNETTSATRALGSLGHRTSYANKEYQYVQLDSGTTASTSVGVVADNQLAFWKSKSSFLVTNDLAQALGAEDATHDNKRNSVAGVFHAAVTAGNLCYIQTRGASDVASDGGDDFTVGDYAIAANGTSAQIDRMAAGTASTHTTVGIVAGAESSNVTAVDLDLPPVE